MSWWLPAKFQPPDGFVQFVHSLSLLQQQPKVVTTEMQRSLITDGNLMSTGHKCFGQCSQMFSVQSLLLIHRAGISADVDKIGNYSQKACVEGPSRGLNWLSCLCVCSDENGFILTRSFHFIYSWFRNSFFPGWPSVQGVDVLKVMWMGGPTFGSMIKGSDGLHGNSQTATSVVTDARVAAQLLNVRPNGRPHDRSPPGVCDEHKLLSSLIRYYSLLFS